MSQKLEKSKTVRELSFGASGVTTSAKLVVAVVAVIALLLTVTVIGFSSAFGSSTTSKTVTQTVYENSIVNATNASSTQGLNPEAIYAYANQSIVELQGVQTTTTSTFFGQQNQEEIGGLSPKVKFTLICCPDLTI